MKRIPVCCVFNTPPECIPRATWNRKKKENVDDGPGQRKRILFSFTHVHSQKQSTNPDNTVTRYECSRTYQKHYSGDVVWLINELFPTKFKRHKVSDVLLLGPINRILHQTSSRRMSKTRSYAYVQRYNVLCACTSCSMWACARSTAEYLSHELMVHYHT